MAGDGGARTKEVVFSGDVGLHSLGDGSRLRFPLAADEEMVSLQNHGDWDGQEGEHGDSGTPALTIRFRKWEDVVLDSFACNHEDHPDTLRRKSDVTVVELAALRHELAVDPVRSFADFAMEEHWHSSDAFFQPSQRLIRICSTDGTYEAWQLWRSSRDRSRSLLLSTATLAT